MKSNSVESHPGQESLSRGFAEPLPREYVTNPHSEHSIKSLTGFALHYLYLRILIAFNRHVKPIVGELHADEPALPLGE